MGGGGCKELVTVIVAKLNPCLLSVNAEKFTVVPFSYTTRPDVTYCGFQYYPAGLGYVKQWRQGTVVELEQEPALFSK